MRHTSEDNAERPGPLQLWEEYYLYTQAFPYFFYQGINDITNPEAEIWNKPVFDLLDYTSIKKKMRSGERINLCDIVFSHWAQMLLGEQAEIVLDNELVIALLEHKIRVILPSFLFIPISY